MREGKREVKSKKEEIMNKEQKIWNEEVKRGRKSEDGSRKGNAVKHSLLLKFPFGGVGASAIAPDKSGQAVGFSQRTIAARLPFRLQSHNIKMWLKPISDSNFSVRQLKLTAMKTEFSTVFHIQIGTFLTPLFGGQGGFAYQANRRLGPPADNFLTISLTEARREISSIFQKCLPTEVKEFAIVREDFSPLFVRNETKLITMLFLLPSLGGVGGGSKTICL